MDIAKADAAVESTMVLRSGGESLVTTDGRRAASRRRPATERRAPPAPLARAKASSSFASARRPSTRVVSATRVGLVKSVTERLPGLRLFKSVPYFRC